MKLNIVGTIFGTTGYDIHTRSLANALFEQGINVKLDVQRPQQWERLVNDAELNMLSEELTNDHITIMISTPPSWRFGIADKPKKFYGFCVWEGDRIPKYWLKYIVDERIDGILVPSQHTKDAILNTIPERCEVKEAVKYQILKQKIHIIPHGVDIGLFRPEIKQDFSDITGKKPFTFLVNKGWSKGINDRGGIQWVLQAFYEEFSNKDDVQLKIKINTAYNPPGWNFNTEVDKLSIDKIKSPDKPLVLANCDNVLYNKIPSFYQEGNVFVSASMAEAFNIPCLEAMSCGLPVITTNFGGQTDFVNADNGWLIDGEFFEVKHDVNYEGISWMKPNIDELRKAMRQCYENQEYVTGKGKLALAAAQQYTWTNSAKKIIEIIKK